MPSRYLSVPCIASICVLSVACSSNSTNNGTPNEADAGGAGASSTSSAPTGGATAATGGTSSTGSLRCVNLSRAPVTKLASASPTKPSGAAGGLQVLNWAGFNGAVSFTFDDNNTSLISNYSKLQATGAHVTFFLVTGWGTVNHAIWKTAISDGMEAGNHTKSHSATASLDDLQAAQDSIKSILGVVAYSMAAPNGDGSWQTVSPQLMLMNRGVSDGLIGPRDNIDPTKRALPAYLPPQGADATVMDAAVNAAKDANKWRIFCVHGFTGDGSAYHPVDLTGMTTTMSNAVMNNVWAETMTNVGAYWLGQKAIPASATTSATWELPDHFPPNMCVRITTTGGTVKQNGTEVPWDPNGYYEISLDAKSVTIE